MGSLPIRLSTRRIAAAGLLLVALLVVGARRLEAHGSQPALRVAPLRVRGAAGAPTRRARTAPAIVVDVEGAVRRPGLVRLPTGARVADAVERAGGTTRHADRSGVNLAAPVSDGQQVLVPVRGAVPAGAPASGAGPPTAPLSLSTASAEQLDALPGIGPVTAQKILDYRSQHGAFHSVDELDAIPGIGPARLADLKGLVVP